MGAPGIRTPILPAETPSTSYKATTAVRVAGNAIAVGVVTTTGGCGKVTFTAETSSDGTNYLSVIDRDSLAEWDTTIANTAGSYYFKLSGLSLANGEYLRLSYMAENAAGTIALTAYTHVDEGGGFDIEIGDIIADLAVLNTIATNTGQTATNTTDLDKAVVASAATTKSHGVQIAGTDGTDARVIKTSATGVIDLPVGTAVMTGSTPVTIATDDTMMASVKADTALIDGNTKHLEKTIATSGATVVSRSVQVAGSDGADARTLLTSTAGKALVEVDKLPVGTAAMAAATPVTIATDDTMMASIKVDTGNIDVNTKHLEKTIATPGSPIVARSVQMAGSDGTDARTISTSATGEVKVVNTELEKASVAAAATTKSHGIQVAGSDGTDARILAVSTAGKAKVEVDALPVGTAAMTASTPVTIATDDTVMLGIAGSVTDFEKSIVELGTVEKSHGVQIAGSDGTNAVIVQTDSAGVVAVSASTDLATHDAVAKAVGPQAMVEARSALPAAVVEGDAVRAIADLYGRLMLAGYDLTGDHLRTAETNDLATQTTEITWANETLLESPLGTQYFPSEAGQPLAGYKAATVQLYLKGGVGGAGEGSPLTLTVTIQATNEVVVAAATRWLDISKFALDLNLNTDTHASWASTGTTPAEYLLSLKELNAKHVRLKALWTGDAEAADVEPAAIVAIVRLRAL